MNDINTKTQIGEKNTKTQQVLQVTSDVKIEVTDIMNQDIPFIGQEIYLDTKLYMSRGADDFMGGRATINMIKIEENGSVRFSVKEKPGTTMNWLGHRKSYEELKAKFGDQRACPDPDYRPEFNRWD